MTVSPSSNEGAPQWSKAGLAFLAGGEPHLFLADGSRLYAIDAASFADYQRVAAAADDAALQDWLVLRGLLGEPYVNDDPPDPFPVHAISLAIAQKCNLGCTYCYAQEGAFGGRPKNMSEEVAFASIDQLFANVKPKERVNIAFLGGEPLANRALLRAATVRAAALGAAKDVRVGFSVTSNGTLLQESDGDFFEDYGFAVTISLDGVGAVHDQLRPFKGGKGSYEEIIHRAVPLLRRQRRMQISARVTVTPRNLDLPSALDHLISLGFFSVGFSPMLASPTGRDEMTTDALGSMLRQMIACGRLCEAAIMKGRRFPFLNLITALKEIHRGTHRPYPCGAGGGYMAVSAEGGYFACHRFVDDPPGAMGSIDEGIDPARRAAWLAERHVHRQQPCVDCGARYLCGGGGHHEVIHRGRPACDYIRGWLAYCLEAYVQLSACRPEFFSGTDHARSG
jgi:uncharacterized protein